MKFQPSWLDQTTCAFRKHADSGFIGTANLSLGTDFPMNPQISSRSRAPRANGVESSRRLGWPVRLSARSIGWLRLSTRPFVRLGPNTSGRTALRRTAATAGSGSGSSSGQYRSSSLTRPAVGPYCSSMIFITSRHVATGYDTTLVGEAEIGAWELASGCRHYYAAWILNLGAVVTGLFLAPGRVVRAFQRGRRCTNLYHLGVDASWPEETVSRLRQDHRATGLFPVLYPIPKSLQPELDGRRVAIVNDVIN